MTILALLASGMGVVLGLSSFPQVIKIFITKSAKDLSLITYLIVEFGSIVWVLYGFELQNFAIVISNMLGLVTTTLVLIGYFLYGRSK